MLEDAQGVLSSEGGFAVDEDVRLAIYVGSPGDGLVIGEVASIRLEDTFAKVQSRDDETTYMVPYDNLHSVAVRAPSGASAGRRAGFS